MTSLFGELKLLKNWVNHTPDFRWGENSFREERCIFATSANKAFAVVEQTLGFLKLFQRRRTLGFLNYSKSTSTFKRNWSNLPELKRHFISFYWNMTRPWSVLGCLGVRFGRRTAIGNRGKVARTSARSESYWGAGKCWHRGTWMGPFFFQNEEVHTHLRIVKQWPPMLDYETCWCFFGGVSSLEILTTGMRDCLQIKWFGSPTCPAKVTVTSIIRGS